MKAKSIVKEKTVKVKLKYPCLKVCVGDESAKGLVVLFIEPHKGVALNDMGEYSLGHFSSHWMEGRFGVYEGEVTIKNEP